MFFLVRLSTFYGEVLSEEHQSIEHPRYSSKSTYRYFSLVLLVNFKPLKNVSMKRTYDKVASGKTTSSNKQIKVPILFQLRSFYPS